MERSGTREPSTGPGAANTDRRAAWPARQWALPTLAAFLATLAANAEAREPVFPILSCGYFVEETDEFVAVLGYDNPNPESVSLPLGAQNFFGTSPISRGQPTVLAPGLHPTSFNVTFSPSLNSTLEWNLDSRKLVIDPANAPECLRAVLSLAAAGNGIVAADPGPLACSRSCARSYEAPEQVTLVAAPEFGWTFTGWGGDEDCADGVVSFESSRLRSCIAQFEPAVKRSLALTVSGAGSVLVNGVPSGCPDGPCFLAQDDGAQLTLTPVPQAGSFHAGWLGDPDCGDGALLMTEDRLCVALFELLAPEVLRDGFEGGTPILQNDTRP